MKKNFLISVLMTVVTTLLLGIIYPLVVTGLAQVFFKDKANGQMMVRDGRVVGSRIIGQTFSGPGYFHSRPSAAGSGYDAGNSAGSQLGPTNQRLLDRVNAGVAAVQADRPGQPVPVDLVTASGSGLDPDISPAAAEFQVARVARERRLPEKIVRRLVRDHTRDRALGLFGEPRVNVLDLNWSLNDLAQSGTGISPP